MDMKKIRLGVAGLGRAFSLMMPTFVGDDRIMIAAGADPREEARNRFEADFAARAYATVEAMCADPNIDAVYVSTPHQCHAQHVAAAAAHHKHILCEKPMALSIDECAAMIEVTERAGVHLIVGHSHSFDGPIRQTRRLLESGEFGDVRMVHALDYTDFLYRPRRPEELDTGLGGGVIYNQAPHQADNVRFIAGGLAKSVRALTGVWDPQRATEGAYSALVTFENGVIASMVYSGYAHFDSAEFIDWIAESGHPVKQENYGAARRALAGRSKETEMALKARLNYGGESYAGFDPKSAIQPVERFHQNFGPLIVSCDRADLRPTSKGVAIYADFERRFEPLPVPAVPRSEVIDELWGAVVRGIAPIHDGRWGLATMELCFAMLESAREGRDIALRHQVPTPSVSGYEERIRP